MFSRRTLLYAVAALAFFALAVTAGKGGKPKPPPDPPPDADPAILYSTPADDRSGGLELWVMNEDGSNKTPVITYATHGLYVRGVQRWSADNSRFLFFGRPVAAGQPLNLYVADSDGSNVAMILEGLDPLNLSTGSYDWSVAALPGQSAEDEWIILSAYLPDDFGPDLFAVRSDGTGLVQLTDTREISEMYPQITPDGKFVLFGRSSGLLGYEYRDRVFKGTLGTDATTGLPKIVDEECITDLAGSPLEGRICGLVSLDPTGTYALISQGYYLRKRWLMPLTDPTAAWLTSFTDVVGPWLDPTAVVYDFEGQSRKWFIAKLDVFTEEETIIASFGKTQALGPSPRRWSGTP
jgi:hypothetical protein